MLLPYEWLKELVEISLSPRECADLLTLLGLEVEAQEEIGGSPVFEIKVTPQRGDCLSAIGVARELAAALETPLKPPRPKLTEAGGPAAEAAEVIIEDAALCPRYSARLIRNVKVGSSPDWLRRRLEQCGVRPINNVVDVTNLVMMLQGQPLHAFDAELLRSRPGGKLPAIVVRRANKAEELVTLDGARHVLKEDMLVIADGERAVALAGVMGGANSEVHEGTTTVLLESAHFDPASIRRTARALGMNTEASYRFERRVDPEGTVYALDLAAELLAQTAQGETAPGVIDEYPEPIRPVAIEVRAAKVNGLLGTELSVEEMARHLGRLGIVAKASGETLVVTPPAHRGDLAIEEDVTEEVARMYGYENIAAAPISSGAMSGKLEAGMELETRARRILLACGLDEAVNYSLEGPADIERAGFPPEHPLREAVLLKNPKVEEYSRLRTSLLPTMLGLLSHNWRRGAREMRLFEIGRVYLPREGEALAEEPRIAALAMLRGPRAAGWGKEAVDFYALKGAVEELLEGLGRDGAVFSAAEHATFAPGRAAQVELDGETVGILGQIREAVSTNYDLPAETYLAEIDLTKLAAQAEQTPVYREISRYPAVERDLALLVPTECAAGKVEATLREKAGELLESAELFDVYAGKSLPAGCRSLAYSLVFRAADRTLVESEIEEIMGRIVSALGELGVKVRS